MHYILGGLIVLHDLDHRNPYSRLLVGMGGWWEAAVLWAHRAEGRELARALEHGPRARPGGGFDAEPSDC